MITTISDIISTLKWGVKQILAVALLIASVIIPLFVLAMWFEWDASSLTKLLIFEGICAVIVLTSLYFIVKIIRDPTLTKEQKWKRLFGKY